MSRVGHGVPALATEGAQTTRTLQSRLHLQRQIKMEKDEDDVVQVSPGGHPDVQKAASSGFAAYQPGEVGEGGKAAWVDSAAHKEVQEITLNSMTSTAQVDLVRNLMDTEMDSDADSEAELVDEDEAGFFLDPSIVKFSDEERKRWWVITIVGLVGWILFVAFYIPFMIYLAKPLGLNKSSWSYNGYSTQPTLWRNISSDYTFCSGLGTLQGPFDVDLSQVRLGSSDATNSDLGLQSIFFHSTGTFVYSRSNGLPLFTCQESRSCGYLRWQDQDYFLDTIALHSRSQSSISGIFSPLELELVHVAPTLGDFDDDKAPRYALLNVLYQESEVVNNTALNPMWWSVLQNPGTVVENIQINALYNLFSGFLVSTSSLTKPPCTPNALWFLSDSVQIASLDQIEWLQGILQYPYNLRPQQPLGDRSIFWYRGPQGAIEDLLTGRI